MILRKLNGRKCPPIPRCSSFKECELVESVVTTTTPDGVISEKKMAVPQYKFVDDASTVRINEVDTDYSLENMQHLGIDQLPVTQPYFTHSIDQISKFAQDVEASGESSLVSPVEEQKVRTENQIK